jgi:transcriptional regulator with XRE-family HTH domain
MEDKKFFSPDKKSLDNIYYYIYILIQQYINREGNNMFSGAKLRKIRNEKRYTIAALAKEAGLHWLTISVYERGKQDPGANALHKIARVLGVSMDDFFDNSYVSPRPLEVVLERIAELAKAKRLNLPKNIYPLYLLQEALGIKDDKVFTGILLALARGRVIELIQVFPCDIKKGMKTYEIPELDKKKYYSFTIIDQPVTGADEIILAKPKRNPKRKGGSHGEHL